MECSITPVLTLLYLNNSFSLETNKNARHRIVNRLFHFVFLFSQINFISKFIQVFRAFRKIENNEIDKSKMPILKQNAHE